MSGTGIIEGWPALELKAYCQIKGEAFGASTIATFLDKVLSIYTAANVMFAVVIVGKQSSTEYKILAGAHFANQPPGTTSFNVRNTACSRRSQSTRLLSLHRKRDVLRGGGVSGKGQAVEPRLLDVGEVER